jgi:hypothetical protein
VWVAHICNSCYPGGGDQEDYGSKLAAATVHSSRDPISKVPTQNRTGRVTQEVEQLSSKHKALSSKLQSHQKKKKGWEK